MTHIAFGCISGGSFTYQTVKSLVSTLDCAEYGTIIAWGDHDLGKSRNLVVDQFLSTLYDQLWFFDTDMVWRPEDFEAFAIRHRHADYVVGGVYRRPQWELVDGVWERSHTEWDARDSVGQEFGDDVSGLQAASYVGAGGMLIPRSVLEEVGRDWFTLRGRGVAEDLSFCLRVHDAGRPVYADFDFQLGHVKTEVLY